LTYLLTPAWGRRSSHSRKDSTMKLIICKIIGLLAVSASATVLADSNSDFNVSGEVSAGLINNSALSVDEIDNVSSDSDSGNEIGIQLNAKWLPNEKIKVVTGYSYQQQNYNTFSQYDLALHQANVDTSYQLSNGEIGLRLDAATASLATKTFLEFQQATVYYGSFVKPHTYIRTSFKIKNKSFAELTDRDAEALAVSTDIFHFINNANTMLMLGVNIEKENAINQAFSFKGAGIASKVSHKFTLFGLGSQIGLDWRYQMKDYISLQNVGAESEEKTQRDDNRHVIKASWSLNILDNLALKTELERGDYSSDLDKLTYTQNVASVGVSYQW
jgi:hypothetical protein